PLLPLRAPRSARRRNGPTSPVARRASDLTGCRNDLSHGRRGASPRRHRVRKHDGKADPHDEMSTTARSTATSAATTRQHLSRREGASRVGDPTRLRRGGGGDCEIPSNNTGEGIAKSPPAIQRAVLAEEAVSRVLFRLATAATIHLGRALPRGS